MNLFLTISYAIFALFFLFLFIQYVRIKFEPGRFLTGWFIFTVMALFVIESIWQFVIWKWY